MPYKLDSICRAFSLSFQYSRLKSSRYENEQGKNRTTHQPNPESNEYHADILFYLKLVCPFMRNGIPFSISFTRTKYNKTAYETPL